MELLIVVLAGTFVGSLIGSRIAVMHAMRRFKVKVSVQLDNPQVVAIPTAWGNVYPLNHSLN